MRMSPSCCCGVDCACCTGTNPSKLVLTISGVTGTDECCTALNNSFVLTQDTVDGCLWSYAEADSCTCDAVTYDLTITAVMTDDPEDGCTITITVQVRDGANPPVVELVRSKVFGAAFDCCTINGLELDPVSNTFETCDCNESSLSTKITANCGCPACTGEIPAQMQVVIGNVTNHVCDGCTNINGTHILDFIGSRTAGEVTYCEWRAEIDIGFSGFCDCARFYLLSLVIQSLNGVATGIEVHVWAPDASSTAIGDEQQIAVQFDEPLEENIDCAALDGFSVGSAGLGPTDWACDVACAGITGLTCEVTAL